MAARMNAHNNGMLLARVGALWSGCSCLLHTSWHQLQCLCAGDNSGGCVLHNLCARNKQDTQTGPLFLPCVHAGAGARGLQHHDHRGPVPAHCRSGPRDRDAEPLHVRSTCLWPAETIACDVLVPVRTVACKVWVPVKTVACKVLVPVKTIASEVQMPANCRPAETIACDVLVSVKAIACKVQVPAKRRLGPDEQGAAAWGKALQDGGVWGTGGCMSTARKKLTCESKGSNCASCLCGVNMQGQKKGRMLCVCVQQTYVLRVGGHGAQGVCCAWTALLFPCMWRVGQCHVYTPHTWQLSCQQADWYGVLIWDWPTLCLCA
eukprot:380636-Pelagomonas_calceolata.AAC.19